jgi:hypothetical protein
MTRTKDRIRRSSVVVTLALTLSVAAAAYAVAARSYREVPNDFLPIIEAAEQAFNERKAEAIGPYLAEDYSWWQVTPAGPREAVRGRAATLALIGKFYQADTWVSSGFERLGMVGNILVQVEEDIVLEAGQPVKKITLNLYEFRNGLRWREWKFFPTGTGPAGQLVETAPVSINSSHSPTAPSQRPVAERVKIGHAKRHHRHARRQVTGVAPPCRYMRRVFVHLHQKAPPRQTRHGGGKHRARW